MTDDAIRCPVCARREPATGRYVCTPCLARIDDDLARIVELTRLASGWLTPASGQGGGTSRPVPASRPPLSIDALDAVCGHEVVPVLEGWTRLTRELAGLSPWGIATEGRTVTVANLVAFLRAWLAWITERPDYPVDDLAREVRDLRWQLEALDPDRDKPGLRIPCSGTHPDNDGRECGYRLPVSMDRAADDIVCPRCRNATTAGRLILAALSDPTVSVWAYGDLICEVFGINANTLRTWVHRGAVRRNGNRYDVGMVWRRMQGVA